MDKQQQLESSPGLQKPQHGTSGQHCCSSLAAERLLTEPGSQDAGLLRHALVQTSPSIDCPRCWVGTEGKHVAAEASQRGQWLLPTLAGNLFKGKLSTTTELSFSPLWRDAGG